MKSGFGYKAEVLSTQARKTNLFRCNPDLSYDVSYPRSTPSTMSPMDGEVNVVTVLQCYSRW